MGDYLSPDALSSSVRNTSDRSMATNDPIKLYNFNNSPQKTEKTSGTETFQDYLQKTYSQATPLSSQSEARPSVEPTVSRYVDPETYNVPVEEQDFTFDDFVDIINPLQHIPVIGTIYRGLSGDTIKPSVRIVGDIVYGAMAGSVLLSAIASVTSLAIEQQTGEEPTNLIADALFGSDKNDPSAENGGENDETLTASSEQTPAQFLADASADAIAPQKVLSQDASEPPIQLAKTALPNEKGAKLAYGGVMAPASTAHALANVESSSPSPTTMTAHNTPPSREMMRIGNRLVPRSPIRSVAMPLQHDVKPTDLKSNAIAEAKMTVATMNPALPGSTSQKEGKSLGDLMKETSDLKTKGGSLPPALVRDMMMMALDKYKMAGGLAPSEYKTGVMN